MNRLVIIGNGFDLAHGLPTGYCDFLKWYWGNFVRSIKYGLDSRAIQYEHDLVSVSFNFSGWDLENNIDVKNKLISIDTYDILSSFCEVYGGEIMFENSFFKLINDKNSIQNWVDIENEYYQLLKECLKEGGNSQVKKLNEEFEQVKKLLEQYLKEEVEEKYNFKYNDEIINILNKTIYTVYPEDEYNFKQELQTSQSHDVIDGTKIKIHSSLLLSFNYTLLTKLYTDKLNENRDNLFGIGEFHHNYIHGEIENKFNPLIFGFGDEMDERYKAIEDKDDNEYLQNMKSFAYFNTSNYKMVIDFLESSKYQVYLMGHSCGLSDRILLNKIFEHKNCISIKLYFYEKDFNDNYTDIIQNVSRHFNKKEMMRERIVNKTLCEPLPQIQLPLK